MMDNFGNELGDGASNATISHQDAVLKELGGV